MTDINTIIPQKDKPFLQLIGEDGNAYFIMGRGIRALKNAGYTKEEIDQYQQEAMSGDYDNLLQVTMKWFDVG